MIEENEIVDVQPDVQMLGQRFSALFIDMICLSILMLVINVVFGVDHVTSGSILLFGDNSYTTSTSVTGPGGDWLWPLLIMVAYFLVQEALFGMTLGKKMMGLRVVGLDGERLTLKAAVLRNVLRIVDGLPVAYIVGIIAVESSPLRQRVGDRLARTLVVRAETVPQGAFPPEQVRRRLVGVIAAIILFLAFCAGFFYYGRPPLIIEGWKNTNQGIFFETNIVTYSLGEPAWGDRIITYPIQFTTKDNKHCTGKLTMQWLHIIPGWELSSSQYSCRQ